MLPNDMIQQLLDGTRIRLNLSRESADITRSLADVARGDLPSEIVINQLSTVELDGLIKFMTLKDRESSIWKEIHTTRKQGCLRFFDMVLEQSPVVLGCLARASEVADDPAPYLERIRIRKQLDAQLQSLRDTEIQRAWATFMSG